MQIRTTPGHPTILLEDAKVCNDIMLRVSLNPARRNQVFHCSIPSPIMPSDLSVLDKIGLPCTTVTYESFKRRCQQQREKSPLHRYWFLLDHFRPYWIKHERVPLELDIDTSTVEEDCHPLPEAPNAIDVLCSSWGWMIRNQSVFPFDVRLLKLSVDFDTTMNSVRKLIEENDISVEAVIPPNVAEGLRRICRELKVPDAQHPAVAFDLTSKLENRVRLYRILQAYPEIENEPILEPVFILGLDLTGTTFLHRMLEASGCLEAPHLEDQWFIPKVEQIDDPHSRSKTLEFIQSMLGQARRSMEGKHERAPDVGEEDICAHCTSFASLQYDVLYDLPQYANWVNDQPMDEVYIEHRRWMQYISWSRRRRTGCKADQRWCFKMPWHARSLPALLKVYPDALLICTHRDPEEVAGSWFSFVEAQRRRVFDQVNREMLGKVQVETLGSTIFRAMDFRSQNPQWEGRWLDVQFTDTITAPVDVACRVLSHAGITVSSETKKRVGEFVMESLKQREKATTHETDIRDYGVDPKIFESGIFSAYRKKNL